MVCCLQCSSWTLDKESLMNKGIDPKAGTFCGEMTPMCCLLDCGKSCGVGCYGQANSCFINSYPQTTVNGLISNDEIFQVWMMPPPCCCIAGCAHGIKQDQKAIDRLRSFRQKSFSKLSSFGEDEDDERKKSKLERAIAKKRRELQGEIGTAQMWKFGGGCCGGCFPTGPGSWKGEALYKKTPLGNPLTLLAHLVCACMTPQPQQTARR